MSNVVGTPWHLSRAAIIWVSVLCSLSGVAGWAVWILILHRLPGQDWMVFHTAARAYFDGDLPLVFDGERLTATINQRYADWLSTPLIFHPWLYPPHFLLLLLPFGVLSLAVSYALFIALTFVALLAAVCHHTTRPVLAGVALALFPQTPFAVLTGQNSFLTGAVLVGGFGLLERRPLLAGALLGIGTYKPQLFLMVPVALIASRQWKALAAAAATALVLMLASWAAFGVDIWRDWFQLMLAPGETYQKWLVAGRLNGQSVYACAVLAGASAGFANAVQTLAGLLGCGCVYWSYRKAIPTDLRLAILLAAALLAAPHVSSQDGILLAVGAFFLFCRAVEGRPRFGELFVIVAVWIVELFDPPIIFRLGIVTPLVIGLFVAVVMGRARAIALTTISLPGGTSSPPA